MTSVREALNVVGQNVSIKELANQREASFPLSLREFLGLPRARPPGPLLTRVIPLDVLQRKFDIFFNERERPLFRFRLHGEEFGSSQLFKFMEHPVKEWVEIDEPEDLGHLEIELDLAPNPDFHFNDLNSDRITLNVTPEGIDVRGDFETKGEELKVNNFPNVDFTGFNITVKFKFILDNFNGLLDLATDEKSVIADVSVDISGWFDGDAARRVERKVNSEVFEALQGERLKINKLATRWLLGGDVYVTGVSHDGQKLTIQYIIPPGQLEPFPENPQAPLDQGLLKNIEHIVVVMMENRSFDHMLGYLSNEGHRDGTKRPDVDGLRGGEKNPYKGQDFQSFAHTKTVFVLSPCHDHGCVINQINDGKMDGFVADFANRSEAEGIEPGSIMGYHTSKTVPVYDALAREFLISDRWFSAHPGPTFPNRFYTLTGRLNREPNGEFHPDNPHGDAFRPVSTRTIFDHLNDRGISWRYYEHGYCFLRMFEHYTVDNLNIVDGGPDSVNFVDSALNGTLPSVTFIDPDFIDVPPGFDDGPPADIAAGQHFIGTVVDALMRGPLWSKTLLLITYDEHGGFFDHVSPPAAVPVSGIGVYGVRAPTFIISPWVDRGKATSTIDPSIVFDHTSIAKTIIRCFMSANPPDMGERVAKANDLSMVLRTTERTDKPNVPVPPAPVVQAALALRAIQDMEDEQDFKGVLRAIRTRYPTPA
jgi:hypothetical protein